MLVGFLFTTDALIDSLGLYSRMGGNIMQLISVVIISYFFLHLPPFNEYDFKDKVEAVFFITKGGLSLYHKFFKENKEREEAINENLITGAITTVNLMLEELTNKSGISVLKKKGKNIVIYEGEVVNGVLYTSEELNTSKIVLKEYVEKFELLYKNILEEWKGDPSIFKPVELLTNELFTK